MSHKSLAALEKDREIEVEKAEGWLRRNGKKLPPEELPRERVLNAEGKPVARVVSLPPGSENWHTVYGEHEGSRSAAGAASGDWHGNTGHARYSHRNPRTRFVPLQGKTQVINLREALLSAVVRKVLDDLPRKHSDLLHAYYIEGRSLRQLARKGEARQTVAERLEWARVAFMRAWLIRSREDIVLTTEDF